MLFKGFFCILQPVILATKKKIKKDEIPEKTAKELTKHVSHFIGTLATENIFFRKTIILKEDDLEMLTQRLIEIMKYEEEKYVVFGVFSVNCVPFEKYKPLDEDFITT